MFYSKNKTTIFNKNMRLNMAANQALKTCFVCLKPFNKRKKRLKSVQISHLTGRFMCSKCADKAANDETITTRIESMTG
jgi:hypothetical protein